MMPHVLVVVTIPSCIARYCGSLQPGIVLQEVVILGGLTYERKGCGKDRKAKFLVLIVTLGVPLLFLQEVKLSSLRSL